MSTNSWRVFKRKEIDFFEGLSISNNQSNAWVNGVYYWVAVTCKKFHHRLFDFKVLAFDMGKEVFELIEWPPIPDTQSNSNGDLLPLPNINQITLWISDSDVSSCTSNHDIWVLSEQGQGQHWTKLLRIGPLSGVYRMFGFWNMIDGNKILIKSASGKLLLYDLETQTFTDIGIKTKTAGHLLEVYTYEESLVATCRR